MVGWVAGGRGVYVQDAFAGLGRPCGPAGGGASVDSLSPIDRRSAAVHGCLITRRWSMPSRSLGGAITPVGGVGGVLSAWYRTNVAALAFGCR